MNVTVFEAINITKRYRNTLALNQVSMSVMQGDIYGFIGENGAGKTTMICRNWASAKLRCSAASRIRTNPSTIWSV